MFSEIALPIVALLAGIALLIFRKGYLRLLERYSGEQPGIMPFVIVIVGVGLSLIAISLIWRFLFGGG